MTGESWCRPLVTSILQLPQLPLPWIVIVIIILTLTFIYIWEREHASMSRGGAEREGDTESEAAPSCQHRARRGAQTHDPRDRDLSRSRTLDRLSPPGAPTLDYYLFAQETRAFPSLLAVAGNPEASWVLTRYVLGAQVSCPSYLV